MQPRIGIIGGGNMGNCLVGGLRQHGYPPDNLKIADHRTETCSTLQQKWGIFSTTDSQALVSMVDIVILAVKPQQIKTVLQDISSCDLSKILLISIAAGITTLQIQTWVQLLSAPVIRAMPNTPALLGRGITGLFASTAVTLAQTQQTESIFNCVGKTLWLSDEPLMDVVTALSGSGPAYFFYLFEAFIKSGQALGLTKEVASKLTIETALGSAYMAQQDQENLPHLRQTVTSKGGTTEQGIQILKDGKLEDLLFKALEAATLRGRQLSKEYE